MTYMPACEFQPIYQIDTAVSKQPIFNLSSFFLPRFSQLSPYVPVGLSYVGTRLEDQLNVDVH